MNKSKDSMKTCIRVITCINNIVILIAFGLAGVGVFVHYAGSVLQPYVTELTDSVSEQLKVTGMVEVDMSNFDIVDVTGLITRPLVLVGGVLAIVFIVGTVSARTKKHIVLIPYAAFLVLLVIFLSAAMVIIFAQRQMLDGFLIPRLETNLHENYRGYNETDIVTQTCNIVMVSLQCCGLNGYRDFKRCKNWRRKLFVDGFWLELKAPVTCCNLDRKDLEGFSCAVNPSPYTSNYQNGCYDTVWTYIYSYKTYLIVVIGGIVALQVIALIATVLLIRKLIKEKTKRVKRTSEERNENDLNDCTDNSNTNATTENRPSLQDGLFSFLPFGSFNNNMRGGFNQFSNMDKRYSMPPDVLSMFLVGQNGCPAPGYDNINGFGRSSFPNAFGTSGPVIVQIPSTPPALKAIEDTSPSTDIDNDKFTIEHQGASDNDNDVPAWFDRNLRSKFDRCNSEGFINVSQNVLSTSDKGQLKRGNTIARY